MFFDPDGRLARRALEMGSQAVENYITDSFPYPEWQKLCQEALVELDHDRLRERIAAAEAAIVHRMNAMQGAPVSRAERQAIDDALAILRMLKRECLGASRQQDHE
jgi:hypothetical protein